MSITFKTCEIMQYMDYMGGKTVTDIANIIASLTNIKTYCIILHNHDLKDDGTPKPDHFHAVLTFSNAKTSKTIADALGIDEQYVNKIKTTTKSAQMYLCHKNDRTKYQYPPTDVIANFDYVRLFDDTPAVENVANILADIESEKIRPYNIYNSVKIETYTKYKRTFDTAFEYVLQKKRGLNRDMKCYYFYGASGSGKTTYAKIFANQNGWSTFVSSGGKNPLDDYKGEDCIILDDLRGSLFSLADFLKLTDNNTDSMVGCRYYNKSLAYCKAIICTSVISLEDLYNGVTDSHKEPLKQLIRRFETVIRFTDEHLIIYMPDNNFNLVARLKTVNPVSAMFNRDIAKRTAENVAKAMGLEILGDLNGEPFELLEDVPEDAKP